MGIREYVKRTVKANTDVKSWAAWDTIKGNAKVVESLAADMKFAETTAPSAGISFEEAMKKYGLSETGLSHQMRTRFLVAWACFALAFAAFFWAFYLSIFKGMLLSALVSLSLGLLMGVYGFREHFFYFQLKQRKLNCTIAEWVAYFFSFKR
jgi:intracellular multiplication protein IcmV